MRVQGVVLEDHGDIAVLRRYVVHVLVVDVELAGCDVLQTGDHAQGRGFAAAGRADQYDKLFVGDLQIKRLNGDDAFVGDLKIHFFFGRSFVFFLLPFALGVGIDLLDVPQRNSCHRFECVCPASARDRLGAQPLYGRSPHCRTVIRTVHSFFFAGGSHKEKSGVKQPVGFLPLLYAGRALFARFRKRKKKHIAMLLFG